MSWALKQNRTLQVSCIWMAEHSTVESQEPDCQVLIVKVEWMSVECCLLITKWVALSNTPSARVDYTPKHPERLTKLRSLAPWMFDKVMLLSTLSAQVGCALECSNRTRAWICEGFGCAVVAVIIKYLHWLQKDAPFVHMKEVCHLIKSGSFFSALSLLYKVMMLTSRDTWFYAISLIYYALLYR